MVKTKCIAHYISNTKDFTEVIFLFIGILMIILFL